MSCPCLSQRIKFLALKSSRKKVVESSDEDSPDSEEVAMLAKKFKKFLKFRKRTSKNPSIDISKGDSQLATQGKKEKPKKIIMCEAFKNFKNFKGKAMNASLSDKLESDDFEDSKEKNVSLMAFVTSMKSVGSASDCDPNVLVETCDEVSQESNEEIKLQEA